MYSVSSPLGKSNTASTSNSFLVWYTLLQQWFADPLHRIDEGSQDAIHIEAGQGAHRAAVPRIDP